MAGAGKDMRSAVNGVSWGIIYEKAFIMRVVF